MAIFLVLETLFKTEQDIFIFQTSAAIQILDTKYTDLLHFFSSNLKIDCFYIYSATQRVIYKPAYTEFHHHLITPWWIYVVSVLVGLIILLIISAIFNKVCVLTNGCSSLLKFLICNNFQLGFFKREKKETMDMYKNSVSFNLSIRFFNFTQFCVFRTWIR
jgi:hypothetical protein